MLPKSQRNAPVVLFRQKYRMSIAAVRGLTKKSFDYPLESLENRSLSALS